MGWKVFEFFKVVLFDDRTLERECFVCGAKAHYEDLSIHAFADIEEWRTSDIEMVPNVIIFAVGRNSLSMSDLSKSLAAIIAEFNPTPVLVMGGLEDTDEFTLAMQLGARGFVPASIGIQSILTAMHVIASLGGTFLPPHVLDSIGKRKRSEKTDIVENAAHNEKLFGMSNALTTRQLAVAQKLRRGMANKNIAYELGMCESTVKVHVREIMKRVKATNRTEAAVILNDAFSQRDSVPHGE